MHMLHAEDLVLVEHCFGSDYLMAGDQDLDTPLCLHTEFDDHITLYISIISLGAAVEAQ